MTHSSSTAPDRFAYELNRYLETIDTLLTKDGVTVSARPFHAALLVSNHMIGEVIGADKDDLNGPFFAELYGRVDDWYRSRYGAKHLIPESDDLPGLVFVYGQPFELAFPATLIVERVPPDKAWLKFLDSVEEEEDPLSWFVDPPNLEALKLHQREYVVEAAKTIARTTRRCFLNLTGATVVNKDPSTQRIGVWGHLANAIRDSCKSDEGARCAAMDRSVSVHIWWPTGSSTSSVNRAASSAARLAAHEGHSPRPRQLHATRYSTWHDGHQTLARPARKTPQSRYLWTTPSTKPRQKPYLASKRSSQAPLTWS